MKTEKNKFLTFHEFVKTRERITSDDLTEEAYIYADSYYHIEICTKESWKSKNPFQKYCLNICNESYANNDIKVLEKTLYKDYYLDEHMDWKYPTEKKLPKHKNLLQEFVNQFEDLMETSKVTIDGHRYLSEWDVKGLCEDLGIKFNNK